LRTSDQPNQAAGWLVTVPLGARQLLELPRRFVQAKVAEAVDKAVQLGAEVVGLGALTAPATLGGKTLENRSDIGVTNGNAFTAAMTWMGIQRLLSKLPSDPHIAVVGATGSVGSCLIELLGKRPLASRLTLVAIKGGSRRWQGVCAVPVWRLLPAPT
jgi:fatty aldehyde-generating acyl-ACP reductase